MAVDYRITGSTIKFSSRLRGVINTRLLCCASLKGNCVLREWGSTEELWTAYATQRKRVRFLLLKSLSPLILFHCAGSRARCLIWTVPHFAITNDNWTVYWTGRLALVPAPKRQRFELASCHHHDDNMNWLFSGLPIKTKHLEGMMITYSIIHFTNGFIMNFAKY